MNFSIATLYASADNAVMTLYTTADITIYFVS